MLLTLFFYFWMKENNNEHSNYKRELFNNLYKKRLQPHG